MLIKQVELLVLFTHLKKSRGLQSQTWLGTFIYLLGSGAMRNKREDDIESYSSPRELW